MADLPNLLLASLDPQNRKQAEQSLNAYSTQPGFLTHLLSLVLNQSHDRSIRLAGGVYLKNIAKSRWEEEDQPLAENDKAALRSQLVPAMLALSNPSDKAIRAQIAESVALIAQLDFPIKWTDLIDQLVVSLSLTDYNVNVGVLETAHSIYRNWRSQVRSDELFTEINIVLDKFVTPFLGLFNKTGELLVNPSSNPALTTPVANYALVAQSMVLITDIFYDLTCQDLPPAIEDNYNDFFDPSNGWFPRLLAWDPVELRGDPDDTTPSLPSKIKSGVLEIAELFIKLYADQLQRSPIVAKLVELVWQLIGSNNLPGIGDDGVVSQSLRFISTAIRSGYYKDLFGSKEIISSLIQGVVIPNISLREHDVEQFEDDPLEFIRLDLALSATGTDLSTRRHAAADVLQALVGGGYETETTEIVGNWINTGLAQYQSNKEENWKAKDSAVFLLTAIATRGATSQQGVTSTNALVDVVKFFSDHVYQDLQAESGTVHPILQVDAIRFLYSFRNQLTKPQLLSVLPLLARHLKSDNYVTYTYAAIAIDRILFIKQGGSLLFSQADIHDSAPELIAALLSRIEAGGTPEKVAENDHLMKCTMRVILTARQGLIPVHQQILGRLVNILGVISKNPSNPHFDQYIFESISGLMRFVVQGSPASLATFEQSLFGPFTFILQQDIDQYIPYAFQVLAQMLELHERGQVPPEYAGLLPFLLTPAVWQQKGSVPGLVKLLKAFLSRSSASMYASGQIPSVLAVVQQRLIPSKLNDAWGFELLQAVFSHSKAENLQPYLKPIFLTLLTRMHSSKTDKFVYLFSHFLLYTLAINVEGLTPDVIISVVESVQPGLWVQLLTNFVIPQAPKVPHKDRKLAVVGVIHLLTRSKLMMQEPMVRSWPAAYGALGKLFSEPQHFKSNEDDSATGITEIDYEEQTAGYQAAYSRLAASENKEVDPVAFVQNPQQYLDQQLGTLSQVYGQQVTQLVAAGRQLA
ncbi:importin alpha re-exporter [Coprinopsis marcescibilis]|uniref:Importin alpha re-exporter n=1 Tax=Coprinopsis marcescibilis TaxID=230819 RepID=A0A5C3KL47_COPMA|nr:importin alpha re-exporter [Coprinopsis marcescibilis]